MLKANVGLSRTVARDYNSAGYSVNLEGEITAALDDHEGVLGRIKELFAVANEALAVEIDRDQGEDAIGRHNVETAIPAANANERHRTQEPPSPARRNGNQSNTSQPNGDAATNKQVQFLFALAKRHRLSATQLESQIEQIVGRRVRVYDLSKREAGQVINALNQDDQSNARPANARS